MNKLKELRARLQSLSEQAQAIVDQDEMSDEDSAHFDSLMGDIETVKASISRHVQIEAHTAEMMASAGRRTGAEVPDGASFEGGERREEQDPWAGFAGPGEFTQAVVAASAGNIDPRLAAIPELMGAPSNYHVERGTDEGYMVPPALRDGVFEAVDAVEDIVNMVDDEPTTSNAVQLIADESTPWGATGVQAYWASEASQFTASKAATKAQLLQLHKLYAFTTASDEILEDGPRLFDRLTRKAGLAIGWKASEAIFNGTGAGQPLGFMRAASLVTVAKEGSQTAVTVNADNIAKMYARNINPGRAMWFVNQDVLPELLTMTLGNQPIWIPPQAGFAAAPGGILLGRPVLFSEHCATLGTKGDVVFGDPLGYYAPRKNGVKFASSMHLYFDYDLEAFRWTFRLGGQPFLSAAVSPAKGSSTKSHFVTLAVRA